MIGRLLARFRRPPVEVAAPAEDSDDDFLRSLLTDPPVSRRTEGPTYLDVAVREAPRPYLELGPSELARHATLPEEVKGRRLQNDVVDGLGGLIDRILLEPMRMFIGNLGVVVTAVLVMAATMGMAVLLGGLARWMFGPLAG